MDEYDPKLVASLESTLGEHLRAVATYDAETFTAQYVRDDVSSQHSEAGLREIVDRLRTEAKRRAREESAFQVGTLDATLHVFERAVVVNLPHDEASGLLVSVDADGVEDVTRLVDRLRRNAFA